MFRIIRKKGLAIILSLVLVLSIMSVVTIPVYAAETKTLSTVDFETTTGYTITGETVPSSSTCWARTDGTVISPDTAFTGKQGNYYFYAENTDSATGNNQAAVYLTLNDISVAGYNDLQIKILVAGNNDTNSGYEGGEFLKIQYSYDGGEYITKSQFKPSAVDIKYLTEDADADGTFDDVNLSPIFTEFTYSIPATGTNLSIRIAANIDQGSEEVGFDNIRVIGTETTFVVGGVTNNGIYNADVTPTFTEGTATLAKDGAPSASYTSGTTVSAEGSYVLIVTDTANNSTTVNFTIDKTAPVVSVVTNGGLYNVTVSPTFSGATATLKKGSDGASDYISGTAIEAEGNYVLVVTDTAANVTTVAFTIDKTAPAVGGIVDNGKYKVDVAGTFTEGTATLAKDGAPSASYTSGTTVSAEGNYVLVVTDTAGNSTTVNFTIDKTAPVVSVVTNGGLYNVTVSPTFSGATATLKKGSDGASGYTSGTAIAAEGNYVLVVTDTAGNSTTVTFTIDKTAPAIGGITNNASYKTDIVATFSEGTATLAKTGGSVAPYLSGTTVSDEGSYVLVVTDAAGNSNSINFTIDQTVPVVSVVTNGGLYNVTVSPTFSGATATLKKGSDGALAYTSGTAIAAEGNYVLVVTDAATNSTTVSFTIDKTAPLVGGITNNASYKAGIVATFSEGNATLAKVGVLATPYSSGTTISAEGSYVLVVTDNAGNSTTISFEIDMTAPVVSDVTNGGLYNVTVSPTFSEALATLAQNGGAPSNYASGTAIPAEGKYVLVVIDTATNSTMVTFEIDKTAPLVGGITNNASYNTDVAATFTEGDATLGKVGEPTAKYTSGTTVSAEGNYVLVVTDAAGNSNTINFTIDKTAPVVSVVTNGGLYNVTVSPTFNEGTATLKKDSGDALAYTSGIAIIAEGSYVLVVTDTAGNSTTVAFTIDKTAPAVGGVTNTASYNSSVAATFTEGTATLAKAGGTAVSYTSGTTVSAEGNYVLVVTDTAGNSTTVSFFIYINNVTATAEADTLTPIVGANNQITLTVKNSLGETDTSFNGTKNITIKGVEVAPDGTYGSFNVMELDASSEEIGQEILVIFINGEATQNLKLNKADTQNISFSIPMVATPATNTLEIKPTPGTATSMTLILNITAPASNGGKFAQQPGVVLKDTYGNICTSDNTTVVTAAKGDTGTWTLTGTVTATVNSGVAIFTNLGATNSALVNDAQLGFTAPGLVKVTSGTVNLPAPIPTPTPTQTPTPSQEIVQPLKPKTEEITVDVKNGDTEDTVTKITIERTTDEKGTKTDTVTYQSEKAVETIEKLKDEGKDVARIVIPDVKDEVSETTVKIPSKSIDLLAEGKINLQIDTQEAKIDVPKTSLSTVSDQLTKDLYFNIVPVKEEDKKTEVENRAKFEIALLNGNENNSISVLGVPVTIETNMPSTAVNITLPLTGVVIPTNQVEKEALLKQLAVYIEHSDGEKELVQGEIVEYADGKLGIKFKINKFSIFTIVKTDAFQKSADCSITKVIDPKSAVIKGTSITTSVANKTNVLSVTVKTSDLSNWKIYRDKACKTELDSQKVQLKVGVNKIYIKVTAEDGKTSKVYTMTITRKAKDNYIIIATKNDFSDAFAGSVLAEQLGANLIRIGKTEKEHSKILDYIKKNYNKKDRIIILGLGKAVDGSLQQKLEKLGYTNSSVIGGQGKSETAQLIAKELKVKKNSKVVLVNGKIEPKDKENIQKACAKLGYPILFVQKDNLTSYTIQALKDIKPAQIYVIGDKSIISAKVIEEMKNELKINSSNIIRINTGKEIN